MVISIAVSKAGQLECCIHLHLYPHGLETQNLVVSVSVTLDSEYGVFFEKVPISLSDKEIAV